MAPPSASESPPQTAGTREQAACRGRLLLASDARIEGLAQQPRQAIEHVGRWPLSHHGDLGMCKSLLPSRRGRVFSVAYNWENHGKSNGRSRFYRSCPMSHGATQPRTPPKAAPPISHFPSSPRPRPPRLTSTICLKYQALLASTVLPALPPSKQSKAQRWLINQ